MAETIKSALFVDYDSIHKSLKAATREAADRFAQRTSAWIAALESGRLVKGGTPARRRLAVKRCYADPSLLAKNRLAFIAGGFEVIDCIPRDDQDRNCADIHITLDAVDALEHPTGYDEFILLSADTDLSPLIERLAAHSRTTVIYATPATPESYRTSAAAVVEETGLVAMLRSTDAPTAEPAPAPVERAGSPAATSDRGDIEALARKVHGATNVPMFSPRTFADLFRLLAQEIAESGYHFQNTAENVATQLATTGRNVNRRQVVFVVKGLALKGHVFSTTDTPERLAEVFREQVLYLVGNANLKLDEREIGLLPAWIAGAVQGAPTPEPEPAKPAAEDAAKTPKRRAAKPTPPVKEAAQPPAPRRETPPPREPTPPPPPPAAVKPMPTPSAAAEDVRTAAASRLAAAARPTPPPTTRPAPAAPPRTPPTAPSRLSPMAAKPAAQKPSPPAARPASPGAARLSPARSVPPPAPEQNNEALESSILAAIAQAVDVLVEDGGAGTANNGPEPSAAPPAPPERRPEPQPSEGGDSDDIGDEIQRIIASYSRARKNGDPR